MANRERHELSKEAMDRLAEAAMGKGLKAVNDFLSYKGNDQRYYQAFKAGALLLGTYSRFYASQTNRMGLEMQAERFNAQIENNEALPAERPKALGAGRDPGRK